jgi:DNA-binding MarR family transcriptional regulator
MTIMRTLKTKLDPHMLDKIWRFICDFNQQFGYPPNLRQIADHAYTSRPNLYRYLDHLEAEGRLSREPGVARGITILESCAEE